MAHEPSMVRSRHRRHSVRCVMLPERLQLVLRQNASPTSAHSDMISTCLHSRYKQPQNVRNNFQSVKYKAITWSFGVRRNLIFALLAKASMEECKALC